MLPRGRMFAQDDRKMIFSSLRPGIKFDKKMFDDLSDLNAQSSVKDLLMKIKEEFKENVIVMIDRKEQNVDICLQSDMSEKKLVEC